MLETKVYVSCNVSPLSNQGTDAEKRKQISRALGTWLGNAGS